MLVEPTLDHSTVTDAIDGLSAQGGTATGDALTAALDRLEARRDKDGDTAPAAIVLLSDGQTTDGSDPLEAADRAKRLSVPISTIALGTAAGTIIGPSGDAFPVPPDPETLRAIADRSGGRAYAVDDADQLDRVYEELGSRIGTEQEPQGHRRRLRRAAAWCCCSEAWLAGCEGAAGWCRRSVGWGRRRGRGGQGL